MRKSKIKNRDNKPKYENACAAGLLNSYSFFLLFVSKGRKGFGLIEIIVGSAIVTLLLAGLVEVGRYSIMLSSSANSKFQALELGEEGLEAVRLLRDASWSSGISALALATDYYLSFSEGSWQIGTSPVGLINATFDRRIRFSEVRRDDNTGDIVSSGGTIDAGTRRVTAAVTWNERGRTQSVILDTYLADIFGN